MHKQNFKEKIGAWLWSFQEEIQNKQTQFVILDNANRMQKGENLLIDHTKIGGEFLAKLLELHYIIDSNPKETAIFLGFLIGEEYTCDMDEHLAG